MPRKLVVKELLLNATYDAQQLLMRGQSKLAFNVLEKKLIEIRKSEETEYTNVEW